MTTATTITICPPWCSIRHDVAAEIANLYHPRSIVVGGAGISPAQAVDLASYLTAEAEALTDATL